MRECYELSTNGDEDIHAQPLEDNLFEWHFTIRGPDDSVYSEGLYHGRLMLPSDYPMSPPHIMILTVREENTDFLDRSRVNVSALSVCEPNYLKFGTLLYI